MNTTQLLAQVNTRADEQQAQVIIRALDNLNKSLERAHQEFESLPKNASIQTQREALAEYNRVLGIYSLTRVQLHHAYKWLRDGEDYHGNDVDVKTHRRRIKARYEELYAKSENLRAQKNKLLEDVDPALAKKKQDRKRSSKPAHADAPIAIVAMAIDPRLTAEEGGQYGGNYILDNVT